MNYIIKKEKTAITNGASKGTMLVNNIAKNKDISILDYGAGRLRNSLYLLNNGFKDVTPLDTLIQSKNWEEHCNLFTEMITEDEFIGRKYDIVLCSYVLNVISEYEIRKGIINRIEQALKEDGTAVIEVRGAKSLKSVKYKEAYNDGFICGNGKVRTFQKPYSKDDIIDFIKKESSLKIKEISLNSDNILLICEK